METNGKMPNSIPLGTVSWKTGTENSLCGYPDGYVTSMTLSQCFPNKYTCDSGHCIELHQKCNTEINCEDKTDETHCQYLRIGSDYTKGKKHAFKKLTQFTFNTSCFWDVSHLVRLIFNSIDSTYFEFSTVASLRLALLRIQDKVEFRLNIALWSTSKQKTASM